jgi:oxygen-independent coproporphyrinogen-3 oxidase
MAEPIRLEMLGDQETKAGNYFVSNYPPYSFWKSESVPDVIDAISRKPAPGTPLGIYTHIPFCRKRCHFCYFRVYTDKNAADILRYVDAVIAELKMYADKPFIDGRKPKFVYFGGGTPSYLSTQALTHLATSMQEMLPWDEAEEVTFECEPGTLTEHKINVIREIGVTRLSLGVEHFQEHILKLNGRAHGSKEIDRAYGFARAAGFPQINIDLIAGMMGDTDADWDFAIERTIELAPDSVTIYQMEIPYNTTIFAEMQAAGNDVAPVATWAKKREWVERAFARLAENGYTVTSAYTAVKNPETKFLYRDHLWQGADLLGLGVASFSHVGGTHFQNQHNIDPYIERVQSGNLPVFRALTPSTEEKLIREAVLQFKLGWLDLNYFRDKFGVDLREKFPAAFDYIRSTGNLTEDDDFLRLNIEGLLQVDRYVHEFFLPQHRDSRYA